MLPLLDGVNGDSVADYAQNQYGFTLNAATIEHLRALLETQDAALNVAVALTHTLLCGCVRLCGRRTSDSYRMSMEEELLRIIMGYLRDTRVLDAG